MQTTLPALVDLPPAQRARYLRILWNADVRPDEFKAAARMLGVRITDRWDADAAMPVFDWLH